MKTTNPLTKPGRARLRRTPNRLKSRLDRVSPYRFLRSLCSFAAILFFSVVRLQAQTQQAWVAHYNNGITNGTNQAVKMVLDAAGNIYVTGYSQNTHTNLGYVTIKYAPNGTQLWAARYDSTNYPNAIPSGLVLDKSNNVIVTGNALTVKYDSNGNQLWAASYAGTALAVDSNTYVYVIGYSTQFNTVKLTPAGSTVWQANYVDVGPTLAQAILVDSNSNVYVTGSDKYDQGNQFNNYAQLLTIKYNTNGNQIWASTAVELNYSADAVNVDGFAEDGGGNLYMGCNFGGEDAQGYNIAKFDSNGNLIWNTDNPTDNSNSLSTDLALDSGTNVLITGMARHQAPFFYATYKLTSNGSYLWTNLYPQPQVGVSGANALSVDLANNVYVTGYSPGTNTGNDIVTIKYNGNGNQAWLQRYNGPGNGNDAANAIAVDNAGNVYVTGYDTLPGGGTEIVTIKYSLVPIQRLGNGDILLQAQGSSGENFDVQATTNLQTWQDLGQTPADTNGLFQYTDTTAPQHTNRYYLTIPQ